MNNFMKAVVSASALLVASQANATNYVIDTSGNPASTFYVSFASPTFINAVINPITHAVGGFTDTFTFGIPFDGFGTGSVTSAFLAGLDLTSATIDVYNGFYDGVTDNSTTIAYTIVGQRTSNGIKVDLGASGGIPGFRKIVLTVNGNSTVSTAPYNGNLTAIALPEPSTWAMLLVGFGAVGFSMRSRRKPASVKVSFA